MSKFEQDLQKLKSVISDDNKWTLCNGFSENVLGRRSHMKLLVECIEKKDLSEYIKMINTQIETNERKIIALGAIFETEKKQTDVADDSTESLDSCNINSCTNKMCKCAPCCHKPLCEEHLELIPQCSVKDCFYTSVKVCSICADKFNWCDMREHTFCDEHFKDKTFMCDCLPDCPHCCESKKYTPCCEAGLCRLHWKMWVYPKCSALYCKHNISGEQMCKACIKIKGSFCPKCNTSLCIKCKDIYKCKCRVQFMIGDLLDSEMQCLVNTVNCVGVMGKGIALEFKKKYPDMYQNYREVCKIGKIKLGKPYCYNDGSEKVILNFPTKHHWRDNSKIEDISAGLDYLLKKYKKWGLKSIAFPALGCNNGGLKWDEVKPVIEEYAKKMDIPVEIYNPI
jgi:O-acetyl-ADP-ribose deacetylase (regulator of RNase III)